MDTQSLRAAREGLPSPPAPALSRCPRQADSSVAGDGVSEGACMEAPASGFPARPAQCSKVNEDGQALAGTPDPGGEEGTPALPVLPLPAEAESARLSSPSWRGRHPYMPRVRRAHRAQTLRPSALQSPPARREARERGAPVLYPCEGRDPGSSPRRCFCPPGREWAMEHRGKPGPEPHEGRARTAGAAGRPLPAPGCRPAPPQHQGSREALPRHRLSLRCHALWMRLRASSNFLLEASWMALWGRSTW